MFEGIVKDDDGDYTIYSNENIENRMDDRNRAKIRLDVVYDGTDNKRQIRINTDAGKDGFLFVGHATD